MKSPSPALALPALLLAACGGAPSAPPAPPALAVIVPETRSVVYVQSDTSLVDVDAQGQTFTVNATADLTLGVAFAPAADGVQLTATFQDFEGRVSNPMAPPQTATEDEIEGPLVFTLDRRGNPTIVTKPEISGTAANFVAAEQVAATLFPRLPGRAVAPGDTWTDTIRIEADMPEASITSRAVVTSTAVGDTVVGGRSFLLVRFTGQGEQATEGSQGGFDVTQDVQGTVEGHFLWDLQRGLLQSSTSRSDMRGTMEVSAAPFPLSVRIRATSRTRLQET